MKPLHIIVEHRQPEYVKRLQSSLRDAHAEISRLQHEHHALQQRFGWEVNLNNELIDLCKRYDIPYREALDFTKHPF